jgi:hypothetical protein
VANLTGWGGRRPGSGPKTVPLRRELAERRLRIIERGIAGDLDGSMPEAERRRIAEARIVEYLHQMQVGKWPELVPMYLGALESAQAVPSDGVQDGVSSLLAALEHRDERVLDVPDESQADDLLELDPVPADPMPCRAPDWQSGARLPAPGPTGVGVQPALPLAAPVGSAFGLGAGPAAHADPGPGAPLPPLRSPPGSYVVDQQNLEIPGEAA